MTRRKVIIFASVEAHLEQRVLSIARDSIINALAWEDRVRRAIHGLSAFAGYAVDEDASTRFGQTIHRLVFERTYLIHYTIDDGAHVVQVIGFRHGALPPGLNEP